MTNKFYLLSLGCPKNEVDAEAMSAQLTQAGYEAVRDPQEAKFLLVNTCGFISSAQEEAISAILDLAEVKAERQDRGQEAYLVVTGCLSQRFAKDIYQDLPEVDACLGTAEYQKILQTCKNLEEGSYEPHIPEGRGSLAHLQNLHPPVPGRSYAYLKISEGCSNACAFCAIPSIRGGQQSRPIEDLVREASYYVDLGYKELILVAQDTTRYGSDLYGKNSLVDLLQALLAVRGMVPLRLMYVYGDAFSDDLIDLIAREEKILPYIDLPIQHASNKILTAMRRRESQEDMRALIQKLRARIPKLVLRSTVMVGFPGESEADFEELLSFIQEIRFDRLGCFIFSPEEGTLAARLPDRVEADIAQARYDKVMASQAEISLAANQARLGEICQVIIEGTSEEGPYFVGRSYAEAPDIDPEILVLAQDPDLAPGQVRKCKIVDADTYSLTAISL
ncbi:MAG: 30S ribosomal protein S12 methylthiotransferase RimO [Eubacteriales bacterium]|nr:30S ribosomal protein S12 methylthiotransferase RimO [Eubacteriales bacterium]